MDFDSSSEGSQHADIHTRPMRVKVLYTFDQDSKTNCLARFQNTLDIPAVAIDESSEVGIIELRQCLQAVTSASPEIISQLSNGDFTVYAYDYSEYDTPLVGQGTLSTVLAAASISPHGSEKNMITGRVCQNIPALFSNGVKETLEVKLRLVPVRKLLRNEFTTVSGNERSISPAMSAGFDPNAWSASLNQNRPQQQPSDYFNFDAAAADGVGSLALMEEMLGLGSGSSGSSGGQQMTGGVGMAQTPTDPAFAFNPAFSHSAPGSRAGTPMMGPGSSTLNEHLRHQSFSGQPSTFADQSRPGSRASVRSEVQPSYHRRRASQSSNQQQQVPQQTELYYNEDGQARKRAKVMQTDWRGKSSFGSKPSDLRVTAATAASMHMHRPIPKRSNAPGNDLEPPPRVPTPVPQLDPMLPQSRPQPTGQRSFLRRESIMESDVMSNAEHFSDGVMSSPEEDSPGNSVIAEGTPQYIPSSPPVLQTFNLPQPSSPGLPTLPPPRIGDSGYMSDRHFVSGNIFENFDEDENRGPIAQDLEVAAQYPSRSHQSQPLVKIEEIASGKTLLYPYHVPVSEINVEFEMPGDMTQLPHKMLLNLPPGRQREGSQGPKPLKPPAVRRSTESGLPAARAISPANDVQTPKPDPPRSRRSSLALPFKPSSSDPAQPSTQTALHEPSFRKRPVQRQRTSSNDSEAGSPAPSDTEGGLRGPRRSGSGAPRRKVIEQRMLSSIASGQMPQYCAHCGAIETPTWRKLYCKECDGKPSPLDYAEGEGETIGIEVLETNDDTGDSTRFMIRKSMKKTKDLKPGAGFEDVTVCNPCGLWFNKFRNMRPADKWSRKSTTRKSRKQKGGEDGTAIATDGLEPQSEALFTDQMLPEDAVEDADRGADEQSRANHGQAETQPRSGKRRRANSMQPPLPRRASDEAGWSASQLDAALARAVQSSPGRFQGSQESPIEVEDLTPKPIRRLLFPSPRKAGEVKSLDDNGQVSLNATPPSRKGSAQKLSSSLKASVASQDFNVFEAFTFDKENIAPEAEIDDQLMHLFEGSPSAVFKTPRKTPAKGLTPRSQRQLSHLLKTPTPASRKRKALTPNQNAANNANMVHDFITSPSSSRYFLRSTPSRQARTPGRNEQNLTGYGAVSPSPFSRHLAQMLSDVNGSIALTSPSQGFEYSDLSTFPTPSRSMEWQGLDEILSSDFAPYDTDEQQHATSEEH